ncbi:hypothetical protein DYH09_28490 [bacterium CPR1]|nr:hypothetical protein [bacterium CPR1]
MSEGAPVGPTRALSTGDFLLPLALALTAFFLQVSSLSRAVVFSDEGAFAEAGRLALAGHVPHVDFPWYHMPGLPLLIEVGRQLWGSLQGPRTLYLALNCLAVLPLSLALSRLGFSRTAALMGSFFYLAFFEMVHQDFRFFAVRQAANALVIGFLLVSTLPPSKRALAGQSALAILAAAIFLPTLLNLGLVALASVLAERDPALRYGRAAGYVRVFALATGSLGVWFLLVPQGFQQVVVGQLQRAPIGLLERWHSLSGATEDRFLYAAAMLSLVIGLFQLPRVRPYSWAMLALALASVSTSASYYRHYPALAGPALAFGMASLVAVVEGLAWRWSRRPGLLLAGVCLLLATVQLALVGPRLRVLWFEDANPEFSRMVEEIKHAPEPLLTFQPLFAVEADVATLPELSSFALRSPAARAERNFFESLPSRAGSLLLEPRALHYLPPDLVRGWRSRYRIRFENRAGALLVTDPAGARR